MLCLKFMQDCNNLGIFFKEKKNLFFKKWQVLEVKFMVRVYQIIFFIELQCYIKV